MGFTEVSEEIIKLNYKVKLQRGQSIYQKKELSFKFDTPIMHVKSLDYIPNVKSK